MNGKYHKIKFVYSSLLKISKSLNDVGHRCPNPLGLYAGCNTIRDVSSNFFSVPNLIKFCTKRCRHFLNIHNAKICIVS